MFERKVKPHEGPVLLDRLIDSGCRRIGILGLHPAAGARTVLGALVEEMERRGMPIAATSVPRIVPEAELITAEPVTRVPLPSGACLATAAAAARSSEGDLELLEETAWETPLGAVGLYRVAREGAFDLYGPEESRALGSVLRRLEALSGGLVLVDGGRERRAFASPDATDGIVLVVGSGHSATPERAAAAARYQFDTLQVPACDPALVEVFARTAAPGTAPTLLDAENRVLGNLPSGLEDPVLALQGPDRPGVATILLPHGLNDEFMIPLVRSTFRCRLVVRDATLISVAPVYFLAWLKGKGSIEVARRLRVVAAATNPFNPAGPDADPVEFRRLVAEALPGLPAHDVLLESGVAPRRAAWRFWGS